MKFQRASFLKIVAGILLAVASFLVSSVLSSIITLLISFVIPSPAVLTLLNVVLQIILFTLCIYLLSRFFDKAGLPACGLSFQKRDILKLAAGLLLGLGAFALATLPLYLSGHYVLLPGSGSFSAPVWGLVYFISVGYVEELMCRGYMQHRLLQYGPLPALFLISGLFSLLHFFNPGFSFLAFINIFLAGCFMGASLYAGKSLWMPVGIHITWNWVQGSVLGIPVSGGSTDGYFTTQMSAAPQWLTGGAFGAEASVFCSAALLLLTGLLLLYAKRNGNLAAYTIKK